MPGNHLMVSLLGQRDELLRLVEGAFPVAIHVRGNEITITGEEREAEEAAVLFEELLTILDQG
ncbi:MAG: PhoH family protein, partial [Acidimicrobiia bacterium]